MLLLLLLTCSACHTLAKKGKVAGGEKKSQKLFAPAASAPPTWPFSATNEAMTITSMKDIAAMRRRSLPLMARGDDSVGTGGDAGDDDETLPEGEGWRGEHRR